MLVVRGCDPLNETGDKEPFYDTVSLDILTPHPVTDARNILRLLDNL